MLIWAFATPSATSSASSVSACLRDVIGPAHAEVARAVVARISKSEKLTACCEGRELGRGKLVQVFMNFPINNTNS